MVKIHTAFDPPGRVVLECKDASLTKQAEADAADINKIVARFEKTGMLPIDDREALFVDVSEVGDYRAVVERVKAVDDYFMSLPASVRVRFENAPANFLDAVTDPERRGEMVELGLLPADEPAPNKERRVKSEPLTGKFDRRKAKAPDAGGVPGEPGTKEPPAK